MEKEIITAIISVVFAFLYIMGIVFCCGKGGSLIAGYHYEAKAPTALKYHKKIMLRIGLWYLFLIASLHACIMLSIYNYFVLCYVFIGFTVAIAVIGLLYFNMSKKMKFLIKKEREEDNL